MRDRARGSARRTRRPGRRRPGARGSTAPRRPGPRGRTRASARAPVTRRARFPRCRRARRALRCCRQRGDGAGRPRCGSSSPPWHPLMSSGTMTPARFAWQTRQSPGAAQGLHRVGGRAGCRLPPVRLRARPPACAGGVRAERWRRRRDRGRGRSRRARALRSRARVGGARARARRVGVRAPARRPSRDGLRDRAEHAPRRQRADPRRRRHLRRLPARAVRPVRSPLPLPVHQLHAVRPALHDRHRRPVRPAADDDGVVPALPRVPAGVRGSVRTAASTPSRSRVPPAGHRSRSRSTRLSRCCTRERSSPSRVSAATTSPAPRRTSVPCPDCARASIARTSPSR